MTLELLGECPRTQTLTLPGSHASSFDGLARTVSFIRTFVAPQRHASLELLRDIHLNSYALPERTPSLDAPRHTEHDGTRPTMW